MEGSDLTPPPVLTPPLASLFSPLLQLELCLDGQKTLKW